MKTITIPDDWVAVPRELTPDMYDALIVSDLHSGAWPQKRWDVLLANVPPIPFPGGERPALSETVLNAMQVAKMAGISAMMLSADERVDLVRLIEREVLAAVAVSPIPIDNTLPDSEGGEI